MTAESDGPTVPIVCTECETRTEIPLEEVADALARHNERRHDGEELAEVDPDLRERIADLAASDLDLV